MYFEEPRQEKQPLRLVIALVGALVVNAALGAALLHSGIDDRLARDARVARGDRMVADLGTLPVIEVRACRAAG